MSVLRLEGPNKVQNFTIKYISWIYHGSTSQLWVIHTIGFRNSPFFFCNNVETGFSCRINSIGTPLKWIRKLGSFEDFWPDFRFSPINRRVRLLPQTTKGLLGETFVSSSTDRLSRRKTLREKRKSWSVELTVKYF